MVKSYSTKGPPPLNQLSNVVTESVSNNDTLVYEDGVWKNKSDFTTDEINCRVLNVSQTADIGGRLANVGVASFVNDEFIFQNGISNLGDTIYIDNNNNKVGINKAVPDEDLDIAGTLRIEEDSTQTIRFYDTQGGGSPDENGRIEVAQDSGGGEIKLYTLETGGGTPQERLSVNRRGALSLSTDYGTAGSILTSQGSSSPPTWNEPYYFSATSNGANTGVFRVLTADNTRLPLLHNASLGLGGAWTTTIETSGKNQFDETTAQWTCPKTGIYNITIRSVMGIDPYPAGNIGEVFLFLYKDTGSGFTTRMAYAVRLDETESGTDPINNISLQITGLFSLNEDDKVRPEVMKTSDDTQQLKCGSGNFDPQFSIHRVA